MSQTPRLPVGTLNAFHGGRSHQIERITAEIDFAEFLCDHNPKEAHEWRQRIDAAAALVRERLDRGEVDISDAIGRAEVALSPLAPKAKEFTIYCAGHAHIDMNWMWSWPETVAVTNDSFTTVLDLLDEFPFFHFSQSQASVYEIVEKHNPAMLERIAEYVRSGRWEVTASHWVEADKNLVSGESLCRHLLYTRSYVQKLFGLSPEDVPIDWSPDTFGHAATVPTYLSRGGVKYLYLHRPGAHGPERPGAFWWQGPDGSVVLTRNDMGAGYNGEIRPAMVKHLKRFYDTSGLNFSMFVFGVGDHGGGPTRRDLLYGQDMQRWPIFPKIEFSTARSFFERLEQESGSLPTLDCELNFEFTGCYTTQTLIKRSNRFSEARLFDTEAAASFAWAANGNDYHAEKLERAWRDTLFSHFHDILPGSGVRATRTYMHGLYQQTMATCGIEQTLALRNLASHVDTLSVLPDGRELTPPLSDVAAGAGAGFGAEDGELSAADHTGGATEKAVVMFNMTPYERNEIAEVTLWDDGSRQWQHEQAVPEVLVRSIDGTEAPAQIVATGRYWGHAYRTIAFPVKTPAFGHTVFSVAELPEGARGASPKQSATRQVGFAHHCSYSAYERGPEGLENDHIKVVIDPVTGGIASLYDKKRDFYAIRPSEPRPLLEYAVERPHRMTAWLIDHTGPASALEVRSVKRGATGPYKATLVLLMRVRQSEFEVTYEVRDGDPCLHIHIKGLWFEKGSEQDGIPVLTAVFPSTLIKPRMNCEIPFGAISRNMQGTEEVPALRWVSIAGDTEERHDAGGLLLLNDCKHGHSLAGGELRVTLIRSSYDPDPLPEAGEHDIRLAVRPTSAYMPTDEAVREATALNHKLVPVVTGSHAGKIPSSCSLLSVEPSTFLVSCVKKAEKEDALLIRIVETSGKKTHARIRLNESVAGRVAEAVETDILERPLEDSSARVADGTVRLPVEAFAIATVLIRFGRGSKTPRGD